MTDAIDSLALLEATERARADGDLRTALEHALVLWRATRDGTVGDAIDTLTRDALVTFVGPKAGHKDKFHAAWLALAKTDDVVAHGWCASKLCERVPASFRSIREREATFADHHDPDPRMIVARDFDGGVLTIRNRASGLLGDYWDERIPALLGGHVAATLRTAPEPRPVPVGERARWRAISGRPDDAAIARTTELLAAVYAAPLDDHPRQVLADHLQELGDPRGEFIALQLAGTFTERMWELAKTYRKEYAGTLAREQFTFRRGFPGEVRLNVRIDAKLDDPNWNTVEVIHGKATPRAFAELVRTASLRGLRELYLDSDEGLAAFVERTPPAIEAMNVLGWKGAAGEPAAFAKLFATKLIPALLALPHLRHLWVHHDSVTAVLASPLATRLHTLGTTRWDWETTSFAAWLATVPATIARIVIGSREYLDVELRRTASGLALRLGSSASSMARAAQLVELAGLARIACEEDDARAVRAACKAAKLDPDIVVGTRDNRIALLT